MAIYIPPQKHKKNPLNMVLKDLRLPACLCRDVMMCSLYSSGISKKQEKLWRKHMVATNYQDSLQCSLPSDVHVLCSSSPCYLRDLQNMEQLTVCHF